jgi:PEGA domain
MNRFFAGLLVSLLTLSVQAQQVPPAPGEFAVLRADRVVVSTENSHLDCSVIGLGDAAQISCDAHPAGSGVPLVYHVALVVGSNQVGYIVSCGGGLVWRIGCHPLLAGQLLEGSVENDKLHVSVDGKIKTYRIETSTYIGPLTRKSSDESTPSTIIPRNPTEKTTSQPSVKRAVQAETSSDAGPGSGQTGQPSSQANTATVMVSSEPTGGDIYVDGNFMGNAPSLLQLPAGSHSVRIEAKGHKGWNRTVSLTAGGKITINAELGAGSSGSRDEARPR